MPLMEFADPARFRAEGASGDKNFMALRSARDPDPRRWACVPSSVSKRLRKCEGRGYMMSVSFRCCKKRDVSNSISCPPIEGKSHVLQSIRQIILGVGHVWMSGSNFVSN